MMVSPKTEGGAAGSRVAERLRSSTRFQCIMRYTRFVGFRYCVRNCVFLFLVLIKFHTRVDVHG